MKITKPFTLYTCRCLLKLLQTKQTQLRQVLQELSDEGLLWLFMENVISDPIQMDLISNFFVLCTNVKAYSTLYPILDHYIIFYK